MYREIGPLALRTGERVMAAVIHAPDPAWAEQIEPLLAHKGAPWTWQNHELLRTETGLDARFFILHRDGRPFANIMLVVADGVALLGHVWTEPADRGAGANSWLMARVLAEFRTGGGRAIFLGTEFDTAPWRYYHQHGFRPVEPQSGYMARYGTSRESFERDWFGASAAIIEPLRWTHWPAAAPLFLGEDGGVARLVASPLFGRASSEGALLPLLRQFANAREPGSRSTGAVLRDRDSAAVLGLASRMPDPLWPETDIVDVFCHSRWWHRATDLLAAVRAGGGSARTVAYCDAMQRDKRSALEPDGFREVARLPRWVKATGDAAPRIDVSLLVRE